MLVLNIKKIPKPLLNSYTLKGIVLQSVDSITYLGVEISKDISWSRHIDKTVKKQIDLSAFLKVISKLACQTLLCPILEYSCQALDPHLDTEVSKSEKVQRRAARSHNTSSVTNLLRQLEWDSLQQRRCKSRLTMLYKFIHGLIDITLSILISINTTSPRQ